MKLLRRAPRVDAQGVTGIVGITGLTGDTGKDGKQGKDGPKGDRGGDATRALLVVFILITIVGVVLAYRTEQQQQEIRDNAHQIQAYAVRECEIRNDNVSRMNGLLEALASLEASNPFKDEAVHREWIAAYQAAKLQKVDCP